METFTKSMDVEFGDVDPGLVRQVAVAVANTLGIVSQTVLSEINLGGGTIVLVFQALNEHEARRTMACVAGAIRPLVEDVIVFSGIS